MKLKWICGLLFATVLAIPASAQIAVYIGHPPPRVRYERRGPGPGPGYAWVGGYWAPQGGRYQWVPGRWDRPPYEGAHWASARYEHRWQGWQLREGHWDGDHRGPGHEHDHDH